MKSLKPFLKLFAKTILLSVFVSISYFGTIFPYCVIWQLTSALLPFDMLILDACMLSPDACIPWHLHVITWHLPYLTHDSWLSHYGNVITDILIVLLLHTYSYTCLSYSCYFYKLIIIIIGNKKDNIHQVRGNWWNLIYEYVYNDIGMLCN